MLRPFAYGSTAHWRIHTFNYQGGLSLARRAGLPLDCSSPLRHPFATRPLRPNAAEWTKKTLRRHSSLFAMRWSAIRHSLPALQRRVTHRSPAPTIGRSTKSPFDRPNGYGLVPSTAEWRSAPLLYAVAFVSHSSSELEQFGNLD